MGPLIIVIEVAAIITTAVSLGQSIAIEVIQQQIKEKIKDHQKQFDALKDIKAYLQSLMQSSDIQKAEQLQKQGIFHNISQIQAFLQVSKNNIATLIHQYPQQLASRIVPTQEQAKRILATFSLGNNLQDTKYFLNRAMSKKEVPSFVSGAIEIVQRLKGVNWKELGMLLLTPGTLAIELGLSIFSLASFLSAGRIVTGGVIFGGVLSGIALVLNIYTIVDSALELKKLIDQKNQINRQIELLPKTELDAMDVVKGSLTTYLAYLVIVADLVDRIRQKIEFVSIFTSNQELRKQFKDVLLKIPSPHQLISLQTIRKTNHYACQLQDLFIEGIDQDNVKDKIMRADDIFKNYFREVDINGIHKRIKYIFDLFGKQLVQANNQFNVMRHIAKFLSIVIKNMRFTKDDSAIAYLNESAYRVNLDKWELDPFDKLIIVKCVASIRSHFFADDPSGQTLYGYRLADYKNSSARYADIDIVKINEEDITEYEQDWVHQYQSFMVKSLSQTFPEEKQFQYYRSALKFQGIGKLSQIKLQVSKSMYFKGSLSLYELKCKIETYPRFKALKYIGEDKNKIKISERSILKAGKKLLNGQFSRSNNGLYYAVMQSDGNFVLFKGDKWTYQYSVWSTKTYRKISFYTLIMQQDGNLCIYDQRWICIWNTNTWRNYAPQYYLSLLDVGEMAIYSESNEKIWPS